MENASKALLIAGSVLIVILLIAFGMRIFNSTTGTADSVEGTMQTTGVTMFNNKFMPYIGNNKSKNDAMALVNLIIASNATNSTREIQIHYNIATSSGSVWSEHEAIRGLDTREKLNACLTRLAKATSPTFSITISNNVSGTGNGYDADGYISSICIRSN